MGSMKVGKMVAVQEAIPNLIGQGYTHVLWADGFDTFLRHDEPRIMSSYMDYGSPGILFSGEKNCWPDPGVAELYPQSAYPWRFINAGTWMAEISYLKNALESVIAFSGSEEDDQRLWTRAFLGGILPTSKIDASCSIFQTMWETNLSEIADPAVVHYNGGVWRNAQDRRYIEHWERTRAELIGE